MNIGIISSSGGSAFFSAYEILEKLGYKDKYYIITDRKCGIENYNRKDNIVYKRITEPDNDQFSALSYNYFKEFNIDFILLFFTRLIGVGLYKNLLVFNIHPSLLPAYKGFNPIKRAFDDSAKFLGVTTHLVDDSVDGGKIISQGIYPIYSNFDMNTLNKISFLQKVYQILVIYELFSENRISKNKAGKIEILNDLKVTLTNNPAIKNKKILEMFKKLENKNKIKIS